MIETISVELEVLNQASERLRRKKN